jgi:uncharacterized membrane protein
MVDAVAAISAVVLFAAVTAATRLSGVFLMSYVRITPRVEAFLKSMSISVLISIVAASAWSAGPRLWLVVGTAALVMVATRSAVGAMLAATALAALVRNVGF